MKRWYSLFGLILAGMLIFISGCEKTDKKEVSVVSNDREQLQEPGEGVTEAESPGNEDYDVNEHLLFMFTGESFDIPVTCSSGMTADTGGRLNWTSSNPEAADVNNGGGVTAFGEGHTVISCGNALKEESVCVNVYEGFGGGSWWDMEVLVRPGQVLTYRNYAQGAYQYGSYSDYIAMHGCALCCTTTIVRAWYPEEDWSPDRVLAELEKEASGEDYQKNYGKSIRKQMPLSLKGISRIFDLKDIPHTYVTEFDKETIISELTEYLRDGHPIVYEAGRGGYHMMLLLGVMADGSFLVSDSVGTQRVRTVDPEEVKEQMFSCKKEPVNSYFAGRKTAGGYILVGEE